MFQIQHDQAVQRETRKPIARIALIFVAILLGLASRRYGRSLPGFLADYAGDTLWALVAFLGIGLALPRASTIRVANLAMVFSAAVEVSQLYHARWIDSIRGTTLGSLVLGHGFLWSDLACYAVGIVAGALLEVALARRSIERVGQPGR